MAPSNASRPHPVTRQRLPYARTATHAAPEEQALLLQFVVLSLLLHILVVLVFGSRVSGSDRRGDGASGALDVTLRRLSPERGSGFTLAPGADSPLPGSALLRRLRAVPAAAVPSAAPVPATAPPGDARPAPETAPPEVRPAPEAVPVTPPPAFEALPRLDRNAPEEVDRPLTPPVAPPPIERIAPAKSTPDLLPPLELPPPAPIERITPAKVKPDLLPPLELPPPAPIERIAPAKVKPDLLPPLELPAREMPLAAPIERVTPPGIERELAPPGAGAAPKSEPVDTAPRAPRAAPAASATDRLPAHEAPARSGPSPAAAAPRARDGIPDAEEEAFKPRGDVGAPASAPTGVPRLDLEATRRRAREIASEAPGSRGLLPLLPSPPAETRKPNLADAIAKAAKPDCRTAYAELGLLAIPPLVASTVGNGGCRW